jgi:hypothetical protein
MPPSRTSGLSFPSCSTARVNRSVSWPLRRNRQLPIELLALLPEHPPLIDVVQQSNGQRGQGCNQRGDHRWCRTRPVSCCNQFGHEPRLYVSRGSDAARRDTQRTTAPSCTGHGSRPLRQSELQRDGEQTHRRLVLAQRAEAGGQRDEKAHGRRRGPFHAANGRKMRRNADAARLAETSESCPSGAIRCFSRPPSGPALAGRGGAKRSRSSGGRGRRSPA